MAGRAREALEAARASSLVLDELQSLEYRTLAAKARQLADDRAVAERGLTAERLRPRDRRHAGAGAPDPEIDLASFYCDEGRWNEAADLVAHARPSFTTQVPGQIV